MFPRTIADVLGSKKEEDNLIVHIQHNSPLLPSIISAKPELMFTNVHDMTMLMYCLLYECDSVAASIIQLNHSTDINAQDSFGRTALIHAILGQCPLSLALLMNQEKLDFSKKDNNGKKPADYARIKGDHTLANRLIAAEIQSESINTMNTLRRDTTSFFSLLPRDITEYVLTPMIKSPRTPSL